jgi:hypothetical protein
MSNNQHFDPTKPVVVSQPVSTGPTSEAGKAISSRNAMRHGCCATETLLLSTESAADLKALEAAWLKAYAPADEAERQLARFLRYKTAHTNNVHKCRKAIEDYRKSRLAQTTSQQKLAISQERLKTSQRKNKPEPTWKEHLENMRQQAVNLGYGPSTPSTQLTAASTTRGTTTSKIQRHPSPSPNSTSTILFPRQNHLSACGPRRVCCLYQPPRPKKNTADLSA